MERLGTQRTLPKTIRVDNGTEFTSKATNRGAYENKVILDFSRPGKPTDNAFIESFKAACEQFLEGKRSSDFLARNGSDLT